MTPYNTKESIEPHLSTLKGLRMVLQARREAGKNDDHGKLTPFVIMGRWISDQFGQINTFIHEFVPAKSIANFPAIATMEELNELVAQFDRMTKPNMVTDEECRAANFDYEKFKGRPFPTSVGWSIGTHSIPPHDKLCPVCDRGWGIENVDDCIKRGNYGVFHVQEKHIGKTIAEIEDEICHTGYELRYVNKGRIRNDIHIDMTDQNADNPDKDWDNPVNRCGVLDVDENYRLKEGDEVDFASETCYHRNCNALDRDFSARSKFSAVLDAAGFRTFTLNAVPNEYWQISEAAPWYEVFTPFGTMTIGWRKRVIQLTYSEMSLDSQPDFSKESTTKDSGMIHAWGYEKCEEYLRKILECCYA